MNSLKITTVGVLLALGASTLAVAQPRDDHHDDRRGPPGQVQRHDPRNDARHDARHAPRHPAGWHEGRGAGPDHRFYRGDRLPTVYRSRQYVVNDWRGHRLAPPPRGYQWVQTGADYVLIAAATGLIAQIILSQ